MGTLMPLVLKVSLRVLGLITLICCYFLKRINYDAPRYADSPSVLLLPLS